MMLTAYDICLIFVGTGDPTGNPCPHEYGYGGKSIPTNKYGLPDKINFCCEYGYEIVIPSGYLPIAISSH
jgi:hypothetical protein